MPRKPPTNKPKRTNEQKTWNASGFKYNSAAWIRLRNRKRQLNPLCEDCLERGEIVPYHTIDHVKAIIDGGDPWDLDNLRTLCNQCHRIKSAKERHKRKQLNK